MGVGTCCQLFLWLLTWVIVSVCHSASAERRRQRRRRRRQRQRSERTTYEDDAPSLSLPQSSPSHDIHDGEARRRRLPNRTPGDDDSSDDINDDDSSSSGDDNSNNSLLVPEVAVLMADYYEFNQRATS